MEFRVRLWDLGAYGVGSEGLGFRLLALGLRSPQGIFQNEDSKCMAAPNDSHASRRDFDPTP